MVPRLVQSVHAVDVLLLRFLRDGRPHHRRHRHHHILLLVPLRDALRERRVMLVDVSREETTHSDCHCKHL